MTSAAMLDFGKLMVFCHFFTNTHQSWWKCCDFEKQLIYYIEKHLQPEFQMAAAAILNFEYVMPFSHYLTNFLQIWWPRSVATLNKYTSMLAEKAW